MLNAPMHPLLGTKRFPQTRMGVAQVIEDAFAQAKVYGASFKQTQKR